LSVMMVAEIFMRVAGGHPRPNAGSG